MADDVARHTIGSSSDASLVAEAIREAVEAEREACAKLCDVYKEHWPQETAAQAATALAASIRRRTGS